MDPVIEMTLDPRDYDLGELRGGRDDGFLYPEDRERSRDPEDVLRSTHYRELLLLQSRSDAADLEKPYLASVPSTYEGEVELFEWLEFLVEKGGFKRTHDALRHYRSLGWLTDDVEHALRDYLAGLPEVDSRGTSAFDQSDHLLSLIYVGRLARA